MVALSLALASAAKFPPARLATLLNQAYADYFLPVWLDESRILQMCRETDVDLRHSVVAEIDDEPVGLALLSRRAERGLISGVGVLPPFRRRGIARKMVTYLQERAWRLNLRTLLLEVLLQNDAGFALYRSLGFHKGRDLLTLILNPVALDVASFPAGVQQAEVDRLLDHYARFHDTPASWQRDLRTLVQRREMLHGIGLWEGDDLVGYLLYQKQQHYQAIHDLAVLPAHPQRLEAGRRLALAVHALRPETGGCIINLPADDYFLPVFLELHYRIWQRQNEMIWTP